jgi:hypothetical protein
VLRHAAEVAHPQHPSPSPGPAAAAAAAALSVRRRRRVYPARRVGIASVVGERYTRGVPEARRRGALSPPERRSRGLCDGRVRVGGDALCTHVVLSARLVRLLKRWRDPIDTASGVPS